MEVNHAIRQVSKLYLNSLWGKFAQKSNLTQTTLICNPKEFLAMLFLGEYCVKYFHFINDVALAQWNYKE